MAICIRYARDTEQAREVVNDGFMKIFSQIKNFDNHETYTINSFRSWVKKIMIYTAIDYYRKEKKHNYHTDIIEQTTLIEVENILDGLAYQDLIKLIQQLSPAYRTVFNLFVIDGFSHEEIAKQLGIAEGTSKSNLAKARFHLKELLKKTQIEVYERYTR
ncbi:MAG: RNA polymerase sigma factor [Verrucomicrobia bacterium]|nr:RNA polymerase sigma factor [Cytophagales bacterium]